MKNTEMNKQLQEFLAEYANGKITLADDGTVEKIEQSNQHFTLTITHEVLTGGIVQYITFKQHESYTHGDDYNELSDVFDYDNVFSVTMANDEVIEIEEKTNAKVVESMEFYKNFKEYFNVNNQQELQEKIEEFEEMENNGFIQNLTLGTYNGATKTFSPRELNKANIKEAVLTYINEMELYDYLQENYNSSIGNYENTLEINEKTLIEEFLESYNVFAIDNNIYVDLN